MKLKSLLIATLSTYTVAIGAPTVDNPLKNEQQRQIYERIQNIDTTIPTPNHSNTELNISQDINEPICFTTTSITVNNATLLSSSTINSSIKPYINRCNGIKSLNNLANTLTNQYISNGYITSRVYIAPQDISDGEIEFYAFEGKVSKIISNNKQTKYVFVGLEGEPLQLKNLESMLEQTNRLRSAQTTMQLKPSATEGFTEIELNSTTSTPLFGSLGINNFGSSQTGKLQLYAGFTWENMLGFSDVFSINLNTTDKQQKGKNSLGSSLSYSIPFGKWLWELSASAFTYDQTIDGLNDSYISHGESEIYSIATNYKLSHTYAHSLEISSQLSYKKNLNKLDHALIEPSTYNLSVGRIGIKYIYQQPLWDLYALVDYHHGVDIFNPTTSNVLKHDFSKTTITTGFTRRIKETLPITYQLLGYAQYSSDLLYAVEQISIGGAYSVRGFQAKNISGSKGGYVRNELAIETSPFFAPYLAYDIGRISSNMDTAGGTLRSATVGLRGRYKQASVELYHAIPISYPNQTFSNSPFIGISTILSF